MNALDILKDIWFGIRTVTVCVPLLAIIGVIVFATRKATGGYKQAGDELREDPKDFGIKWGMIAVVVTIGLIVFVWVGR